MILLIKSTLLECHHWFDSQNGWTKVALKGTRRVRSAIWFMIVAASEGNSLQDAALTP